MEACGCFVNWRRRTGHRWWRTSRLSCRACVTAAENPPFGAEARQVHQHAAAPRGIAYALAHHPRSANRPEDTLLKASPEAPRLSRVAGENPPLRAELANVQKHAAVTWGSHADRPRTGAP